MATNEPMTEGVAGRYAAALFDLATDAGSVPAVEADLSTIQRLLEESDDLRRLIASPVFAADDQARAIAAVVEKAGIGGLAANFVKLVARNRRLFTLPGIIKSFHALAARARGEMTAEVTSAVALSDEQAALLKETIKASVGKDITLETRVDPSLIGGLVVKVGSRMIDSSLKTKLASLKAGLSGSSAF